MYLYVYALFVICMTELGLGENDVKCKSVGFQCDEGKRKIEFCKRVNVDPEVVETCAEGQVCSQEENNVKCIDQGSIKMKFMCTGKGEFPDTKNCSLTYICSGEGEEPSEICTCPTGSYVYPAPGLFCTPGNCPRQNITCVEGTHGYFTLLNGQKTSYYYYCLSSDKVQVYGNVEVESKIVTVASRLRIMKNNGKECIPQSRDSSSPTPTGPTTPGSSSPTPTGPTTPGSSSPTSTEPTTPGSSSPTPTGPTTPGSSSPTPTGPTTPGSSSPTSTEPTTPDSSSPTSTEPTTPGSSSPTPTGPTTPGSSSPTPTEPTTPDSSSPTPTGPTTPGSSSPTPTEPTTPDSSSPTPTGPTTPGSSSPTPTEPTTPDSSSPTPTEPTKPTPTPVPPEEKPKCKSKGELYETECDCDYYKCDSNLKPIRRTCSVGLKYHAKLKRCVFGECDESKCINRLLEFIF